MLYDRASLDSQLEATEGLGHSRVRVVAGLVEENFFGTFNHLEGKGILTESQVLGGNETIQEDVDTYEKCWLKRKHIRTRSSPSRTE